MSIALLAEWRSRSRVTTIGELAEDTGLTRRATVAAIAELKGAGLVGMAKEFGPHRSGEVVLMAWDDLVVTSSGRGVARKRTAPISAVPDESNRAPTAPQSRSNRAETAPLSRDPARSTCTNGDLLGKEAKRERGSVRGAVRSGGAGEDLEKSDGEKNSSPTTNENGTTTSAKCGRCDGWTIRPPDAGPYDATCRCPSPSPKTKVSWVRP